MKVILYSTQHGATKKVGEILNEYLKDCLLMDIEDIDYPTLKQAEIIIIGTPIYYRRLNHNIVSFIKGNQELLISKKYCLYVVGVFSTEFMTFVTESFDYHILKDMKVIAGVGGEINFSQLSLTEKMVIQVMNKRSPIMTKTKDIFQNINDEEIKIFVDKIKRL